MTEEEMNEEYKNLAERYELKEEQVRQIVPEESLKVDLCVEKAMKFVRDNAKVTEVSEDKKPAAKKSTKKKAEATEESTPAEETPRKNDNKSPNP